MKNTVKDIMEFPATKMAHTPSGSTPVCEKHGDKLQGLSSFMGWHINFTMLEQPMQCQNCLNEHTK